MLQQFYPVVAHPFRFELNRDMDFAAAHYIEAEGAGKCQRLHGHTYFVNITICGDTLDSRGFLVDFAEIKHLVQDKFDHTLLNNSAETDTPSTEFMAKAISDSIRAKLITQPNKPECLQVVLRETPGSYVVFRHYGANG